MDPYDDLSPEGSEADDFSLTDFSRPLNGPSFATEGNLASCIDYLQSALANYGIDEQLSFDTGPTPLVDACNAMYALLRRLQQQVERTEAAEDQLVKMDHSIKIAKQANTNLQAALQDKDKEIGSLRNQVSAVVTDQAGKQDKANTERRELQRKMVDLETKSKRAQTELKRKEQELTKANTKLRELLDQKSTQARHMRQLSSALTVHSRNASFSSVRSDGSGDVVSGSAESRMQTLKDTYESKYKELQAKHTDLQTAYSRLQDTYKGLLFQQLRSGAKENVRYAANDASDDGDDDDEEV